MKTRTYVLYDRSMNYPIVSFLVNIILAPTWGTLLYFYPPQNPIFVFIAIVTFTSHTVLAGDALNKIKQALP